MTVHFPLALLLASGIFTLVYLRWGEQAWEVSAYHCLIVGWVSGVVALVSGALDALRQLVGPAAPGSDVVGWVNAHAFLNLTMLVVYGQALLLRRRSPGLLDEAGARRGYLLRHFLGALLLVAGGWAGGHLVYGLGLGR